MFYPFRFRGAAFAEKVLKKRCGSILEIFSVERDSKILHNFSVISSRQFRAGGQLFQGNGHFFF